MLHRCVRLFLKARPKTVSVEPGSNRLPDSVVLAKGKDIFAVPDFPGKRVMHNWRFFIKAGKAATGPPVGQEFSKLGLKAMDFAKAFNDRTKPHFKDDVELIVRIQVYFDKTYMYSIEPPPTAWFILRALRKKRRETGPVSIRGCYCALMTLEMAYEIAKMKPKNWGKPEYPLLETRVRRVVGQARRMGVCFIGVDTPGSSPVKGMTERQYAEESAKYRKIHAEQYTALKQRELQEAPLIERLHRPNMTPLTEAQIEEGLRDANLMHALWKASHPKSPYHRDLQQREMARRYLNARGWLKDMTLDEMQVVFMNHRLPDIERSHQMDDGKMDEHVYWSRDSTSQ
ncbi:putative ribosomal protein L11 [Trypanosoma theileri]|uniref:Putative ribosomal protein L11 n=1 Tax=Trypanosoma theileri TaxID=67003 RepID=A0A1X0NR49_9TRYP|nr:putative ribosomal protein L11 [Trypanosoma theileri]ORC87167.1 putative ribosomal protein L11 [Trypanosoma theileri]